MTRTKVKMAGKGLSLSNLALIGILGYGILKTLNLEQIKKDFKDYRGGAFPTGGTQALAPIVNKKVGAGLKSTPLPAVKSQQSREIKQRSPSVPSPRYHTLTSPAKVKTKKDYVKLPSKDKTKSLYIDKETLTITPPAIAEGKSYGQVFQEVQKEQKAKIKKPYVSFIKKGLKNIMGFWWL